MILSLHKQPFVTAHFQFITAHFVRQCALKNALLLLNWEYFPAANAIDNILCVLFSLIWSTYSRCLPILLEL